MRLYHPFLLFFLSFTCLAHAEVETTTLQTQAVAVTRQFDGVVEAVNQATVSGQTSGRVADILFDVGDSVAAGATIIRLVSEDQQGNLQQAQAALAEANAGLRVNQLELERISALFDQGVLPKAEVDRASGKVKASEAQVKNAEGALRRARQQLDYTVVKAPFGGVVSERHVELGEAVNPGTPLMSGFDPDQLRISVEIPQDIAAQVQARPQFQILNKEQTVVPDTVRLYPLANPVSGTLTARLNLPQGNHGLMPGQWVKVAVVLGEQQQLLIPQRAVMQRAQISNVYVKTADAYRLLNVRLGKRYGQDVAVSAGLNAGDVLVLNPLQLVLQQSAAEGSSNE